jgi:hypothetical protein
MVVWVFVRLVERGVGGGKERGGGRTGMVSRNCLVVHP